MLTVVACPGVSAAAVPHVSLVAFGTGSVSSTRSVTLALDQPKRKQGNCPRRARARVRERPRCLSD